MDCTPDFLVMKEKITIPLDKIEQTPTPKLLDIVKIDGVWAQVCQTHMLRFLDDGRYEEYGVPLVKTVILGELG